MAYRRKAVVSDIHGNLEALLRVEADIVLENNPSNISEKKPPIEDIICLGDIVGYGPNQRESLDKAKKFKWNLRGNHETYTIAQIDMPTLVLKDSAFNTSPSASKAIEFFVNQLLGEQKIKSDLTGEMIELPREDINSLKKEAYPLLHAELILRNAGIDIESPKMGLLQRTLSKEQLDKIGESYFTHILSKKPHLLESYFLRLKRRQQVLDDYEFLNSLKTSHREGNALYVHDDPFQPGSTRYLIDPETTKTAKMTEVRNTIGPEGISEEEFPEIKFIFAGHTHVLPKLIEVNGIRVIYVGSVGIPRKDNVKQKYACYTIITVDEDDNIVGVQGKRLTYKWQVTQKKMRDAGLYDKFEELIKREEKS